MELLSIRSFGRWLAHPRTTERPHVQRSAMTALVIIALATGVSAAGAQVGGWTPGFLSAGDDEVAVEGPTDQDGDGVYDEVVDEGASGEDSGGLLDDGVEGDVGVEVGLDGDEPTEADPPPESPENGSPESDVPDQPSDDPSACMSQGFTAMKNGCGDAPQGDPAEESHLFLEVTYGDGKAILHWTRFEGEGFGAYKVVCTLPDSTPHFPTSGKVAAAFTDINHREFVLGLSGGGSYRCEVVAVRPDHTVLARSNVVDIHLPDGPTPPTTQPIVVGHLGIEVDYEGGKAILHWSHFEGEGFGAYKVICAAAPATPSWPGGGTVVVAIGDINQTEYAINVGPGSNYNCRIVVVSTGYVLLAQTEVVLLSLPIPPTTTPPDGDGEPPTTTTPPAPEGDVPGDGAQPPS